MYEPPTLPTAEKMTGIKAMVSKLWLIERLGHWNFWLKRFFSPFKQLELNIQTYPPSCTILNFVSSPVAAKLASSNAAPLLSFILPVLALFITLSMSLICTRCVSIRSPTCKMGFFNQLFNYKLTFNYGISYTDSIMVIKKSWLQKNSRKAHKSKQTNFRIKRPRFESWSGHCAAL